MQQLAMVNGKLPHFWSWEFRVICTTDKTYKAMLPSIQHLESDRFLVEQGRAEVRYLWCIRSLGLLGCIRRSTFDRCRVLQVPTVTQSSSSWGFECPETNNQNYKMANVASLALRCSWKNCWMWGLWRNLSFPNDSRSYQVMHLRWPVPFAVTRATWRYLLRSTESKIHPRRGEEATLPTLRSDCKKAAEINKRENVDWKAQDSGCLKRPQVRTRYDKHQDCGLRNIATCEKIWNDVVRGNSFSGSSLPPVRSAIVFWFQVLNWYWEINKRLSYFGLNGLNKGALPSNLRPWLRRKPRWTRTLCSKVTPKGGLLGKSSHHE